MRRMKFIGLAVLMVGIMSGIVSPWPVLRADSGADPSAAAIRQVLNDQVAAWNRGDVDTFMRGYKDSPDTTFIGKSIQQGYAPILARYKKGYPNKDAMGTLDFSDLAVRALDAKYAVVTGRFHLARNAQGGGDVSGIFSLVWENTAAGWKIIVDHSSVTTP
jgi:uncharacterized protein (TIGR02246 family)